MPPNAAIPPINALIFMKGHSARVPRKNLRPFCGRPLCAWIMDSLSACRHIGRIIVNTDSLEIADTVRTWPKAQIHHRPPHLLGDHVVANPIIEWDLAHSEGEFYLQSHSTNPLLKTETIQRSIEEFFAQKEHDSLFSVTGLRRRFYWADGRPVNHDPARLIPTQELGAIYEENSCIYLFSKNSFKATGRRLGVKPMMFEVPALEAVDIDEEHEFRVAEAIKQVVD